MVRVNRLAVPILAPGLLLIGVVIAAADDPGSDGPAWRADQDRAIAESRALTQPQYDVIARYNGKADAYRQLPIVDMDANVEQLFDISPVIAQSEVVALVEVTAVSFEPAGIADFPAVRMRYRVIEPIKGVAKGDRLETSTLGGPYRNPTGEDVFLVLREGRIEAPGDRLVVFFDRNEAGYLGDNNALARLQLAADGTVISEPRSVRLHVAGRPIAEVVSDYRRIAARQAAGP